MAKGKKTGGRDFRKGTATGRPKGAKDKIPRGFKGSIKVLFQEFAKEKPELFRQCIEKGLKASAPKSAPYLTLAAHYMDGKPKENVTVEGGITIEHIDRAREELAGHLARLATRVGTGRVVGELKP